jgi:predicted GNAT superfamily acetyltransferase
MMNAEKIVIRRCTTLEEFERCVELQRATWQESIIVPSAMFVVAEETGGQVIGAFADDQLVGFLMSLVGTHGEARDNNLFLHSHMTAVLPAWRNRGVGRRLKLAQRDDALRRGIGLIEWTFDPLELGNAHFNFRRLGAIARRVIPNCYGITESPLHAGMPTDRLVAEWHLTSVRVDGVMAGTPSGTPANAVRIAVPPNIGELRRQDRAAATRQQSRIRREFKHWFARGFAAIDFERAAGDSAHYVLAPLPQSREIVD